MRAVLLFPVGRPSAEDMDADEDGADQQEDGLRKFDSWQSQSAAAFVVGVADERDGDPEDDAHCGSDGPIDLGDTDDEDDSDQHEDR